MGFEDDITRYHLRLDGLAQSTLRDLNRDISGALKEVERKLTDQLDELTAWNQARLQAMWPELTSLSFALSRTINRRLDNALDAVVETSATVAERTAPEINVAASTSSPSR